MGEILSLARFNRSDHIGDISENSNSCCNSSCDKLLYDETESICFLHNIHGTGNIKQYMIAIDCNYWSLQYSTTQLYLPSSNIVKSDFFTHISLAVG